MAVVPARPPRIVNHQTRPVYLTRPQDGAVLVPRRETVTPGPGSYETELLAHPVLDEDAYGYGTYGSGTYGDA